MSVGEEDPFEVVPKGEDHDTDEQDQPDLLRQFPLPLAQRLAQNALDEEEKQVTSIQDRNWEQVQDAKVDTEQRDEENDVGWALRCGLAGNLRDRQRSADVLARNITHDHFVEPDKGEL